jgi:hypothetical protein
VKNIQESTEVEGWMVQCFRKGLKAPGRISDSSDRTFHEMAFAPIAGARLHRQLKRDKKLKEKVPQKGNCGLLVHPYVIYQTILCHHRRSSLHMFQMT